MISYRESGLSQSRVGVEWCRDQQRQALEHMASGHTCEHPQCTPKLVEQWLLDNFAEELEIQSDV